MLILASQNYHVRISVGFEYCPIPRSLRRCDVSNEANQETTKASDDPRRRIGRIARFLPPAPRNHADIKVGDLRALYERRHWFRGVALITVVMLSVTALMEMFAWSRNSMLSLLLYGVKDFIVRYSAQILLINLTVLVLTLAYGFIVRRYSIKSVRQEASHVKQQTRHFLNRGALEEEQIFREGAENWNLLQKAWSCIVFGGVHFGNIIFPLAALPF